MTEHPKGLQMDSQTDLVLLMALRMDLLTHWASPKVLQRDSLILTEHPMGLQMDSQTHWVRLMALRMDILTHWASPKVLQRD
jgi:hypothetical protein